MSHCTNVVHTLVVDLTITPTSERKKTVGNATYDYILFVITNSLQRIKILTILQLICNSAPNYQILCIEYDVVKPNDESDETVIYSKRP